MSSQGPSGKHSFQGDASEWTAYKKRANIAATLTTATQAANTQFNLVQSNQLRIDLNLGLINCLYPTLLRYPQIRVGRNCSNNF